MPGIRCSLFIIWHWQKAHSSHLKECSNDFFQLCTSHLPHFSLPRRVHLLIDTPLLLLSWIENHMNISLPKHSAPNGSGWVKPSQEVSVPHPSPPGRPSPRTSRHESIAHIHLISWRDITFFASPGPVITLTEFPTGRVFLMSPNCPHHSGPPSPLEVSPAYFF